MSIVKHPSLVKIFLLVFVLVMSLVTADCKGP